MKLPTIRVMDMIALVGVSAAAMASVVFSSHWTPEYVYLTSSSVDLFTRVTCVVSPIFQSTAVTIGLAIIASKVFGIRKTPLGFGRLTWVAAGMYIFVQGGLDFYAWQMKSYEGYLAPQARTAAEWLGTRLIYGRRNLGAVVPATWVVLWLASPPHDPQPDSTEWMGRIFGMTVICHAIWRHIMQTL